MGKIFEASELPESEKVYLKKDYFGWRVVEPPTKWYHYIIGSKRNFVVLIIILLILGMFYVGTKEIIAITKQNLLASDECNLQPFHTEKVVVTEIPAIKIPSIIKEGS